MYAAELKTCLGGTYLISRWDFSCTFQGAKKPKLVRIQFPSAHSVRYKPLVKPYDSTPLACNLILTHLACNLTFTHLSVFQQGTHRL